MTPSIDDLRMIVAVAEGGSLTEAARRLDVSLNAVSRRLARLEEAVGVLLVQRTTRSCQLTEAAERMYGRALVVLEQVDLVAAELAGHRASPHGTVRVQLPAVAVSEALLHRLRGLMEAHEGLRVKLSITRRDAPVGSSVDVALFVGQMPDLSGVVARRISPARWVLCASTDYVQRWGAPQSPAELLTHECLRFRVVGGSEEWPLEHAGGERVRVAVPGSFEADDGRVLGDAMRAGLGIGVRLEREVSASDRVVRVLPEWTFVPPPIYLAGPRGRWRMPAVRLVVDAVLQVLEEFQADTLTLPAHP